MAANRSFCFLSPKLTIPIALELHFTSVNHKKGESHSNFRNKSILMGFFTTECPSHAYYYSVRPSESTFISARKNNLVLFSYEISDLCVFVCVWIVNRMPTYPNGRGLKLYNDLWFRWKYERKRQCATSLL